MLVDSDLLVPMSEANQNFSRVARLVDERGRVVIMRNNAPAYVVSNYDDAAAIEILPNDEIMASARSIMDKFRPAFEELAK